jgi:hypothetical protein
LAVKLAPGHPLAQTLAADVRRHALEQMVQEAVRDPAVQTLAKLRTAAAAVRAEQDRAAAKAADLAAKADRLASEGDVEGLTRIRHDLRAVEGRVAATADVLAQLQAKITATRSRVEEIASRVAGSVWHRITEEARNEWVRCRDALFGAAAGPLEAAAVAASRAEVVALLPYNADYLLTLRGELLGRLTNTH